MRASSKLKLFEKLRRNVPRYKSDIISKDQTIDFKKNSNSFKLSRMLGIKPVNISYSSAKALLDTSLIASSSPIWYDDNKGKIIKDFRSKHTVILLHIWMLHKRLLTEGEKGREVQECLFDAFWEETSGRIRNLGVGELSVNTRLSEVQGYSFKTCIELDDAISRPTEDERIDEIAGTLWRMLYLKREDINSDHVIELAQYIRGEQVSLFNISKNALLEGRIAWEQNKLWGGPANESSDSKSSVWRESISISGKPYYWNAETKETTWELPY